MSDKKDKKKQASVQTPLLSALRNPAAEVGGRQMPMVDAKQTPLRVAKAVRDNLPQDKLYLMNDEYLTIATGHRVNAHGCREMIVTTRPMDYMRFITWVEQSVAFFKTNKEGDAVMVGITPGAAQQILACDYFRAGTPEIREIAPVRLPRDERAEDGARVAALSAPGYDPQTRVYTVNSVDVPDWGVMSKEKLLGAWMRLFGEFPYDDIDIDFMESRSAAAAIAVTMGLFCRNLISRMPICVVNAKKRGTGKTHLCKLMLSAVYGTAVITPKPQNDEELRKTLASCAAGHRQYAFLDDLKVLSSSTINQYATGDLVDNRTLGKSEMKQSEMGLFLLATGNNIATTPDIERRSIFIDLQYPGDVKERRFSGAVDEKKFGSTEFRQRLLGLYWATYRGWVADGAPVLCPGSCLPSFESFCEVACSIAMWLGLPNPTVGRAEWANSGDIRGHEVEYLIQHIASVCVPADANAPHKDLRVKFNIRKLMDIAETETHTLDIIADPGPGQAKSFGHRVSEYWGNEFVDCHGRRFFFGKRKGRRTTIYSFEFVSEPDKFGQLPFAWAKAAAARAGVDWAAVPFENREVFWRWPGGGDDQRRKDDEDGEAPDDTTPFD